MAPQHKRCRASNAICSTGVALLTHCLRFSTSFAFFFPQVSTQRAHIGIQHGTRRQGISMAASWHSQYLHQAAQMGDLKSLRLFMRKGMDPQARGPNGRTPLHEAASAGRDAVVWELGSAGAFVDVTDPKQHTPLHFAVKNGHVNAVRALVRLGADVRATDDKGMTPLHCAGSAGNPLIYQSLIEAGAHLEARGSFGCTPLHTACFLHRKGGIGVHTLIQYGADVHALDEEGWTPLMYAVEKNHPELIGLLAAAGSDVNVRDDVWRTPLHRAITPGREKAACVHELARAGADVNMRDIDGFTPLMLAARCRSESYVPLLLSGADVNAVDPHGLTAMHWAMASGHGGMVRALMEAGADVGARDGQGRTPAEMGVYATAQ